MGVPDLRLFIRGGDEVDLHRRLALSGLAFGTCLAAKYLHPYGTDEFKPILGGRMHTQYPDNDVKRFYTYRNRGYVQSQRGQRRLIPQEWVRFGWYFLVTRRDPAGLREWWRLRRLGRQERFGRFENLGERSDGGKSRRGKRRERQPMTFTDAAAQSKTFSRAWSDLVVGFGKRELWLHLLAGHQAALPAQRARPVLDHHRHRHHGRRIGRVVLTVVPPEAGRASALCDARPDHLEHDQRRDHRGRRRVRGQRGSDQTAAHPR